MNLIIKYIYSDLDNKYLDSLKSFLNREGKLVEGLHLPSALDITIYLEEKEDFYLLPSLINFKQINNIYLELINLSDVPF